MKKIWNFVQEWRWHQWYKASWTLLPFMLNWRTISWHLPILAATGMIAASSIVYSFNDYLDIEKDKQHPIRALRPFAAGKLSERDLLFGGVFLAIVLGLSSYFLGNGWYFAVVLGYLTVNVYYTLAGRYMPYIEALLYGCVMHSFRVVAGAVFVPLSPAIIACIIFAMVVSAFALTFYRYMEKVIFGDRTRKVLAKYSYKGVKLFTIALGSLMVISLLMFGFYLHWMFNFSAVLLIPVLIRMFSTTENKEIPAVEMSEWFDAVRHDVLTSIFAVLYMLTLAAGFLAILL